MPLNPLAITSTLAPAVAHAMFKAALADDRIGVIKCIKIGAVMLAGSDKVPIVVVPSLMLIRVAVALVVCNTKSVRALNIPAPCAARRATSDVVVNVPL